VNLVRGFESIFTTCLPYKQYRVRLKKTLYLQLQNPKAMKKYLLLLFITTITSLTSFSQSIITDTCITAGGGGGGNVVVFSNYDGGVLNINVDQNIPNIKIGVCTYEPVTINLSGPFVGNVTEVRYAGYVSTSNFHCPNSPATTTIVGAPGGATTSVNFLPAAPLSNPNGYSMIVCGYSCSNITNQGGCNTADQIQDYFTTTMGGTLYSYFTQYGCWSVSPYNISSGSNCPLSGVNDTTVTLFTSTASSVCLGHSVNFTDLSPGATSWTWSAPGSNIPTSTNQHLTGVQYSTIGTYTVTLTVNDGTGTCSASHVINVMPLPSLNITAVPNPICEGDTTILHVTGGGLQYIWGSGGPMGDTWVIAPPASNWYDVLVIGINGCTATDSIYVTVYPTPIAPTINYSGGVLTASPSAPIYQWYLNGNPIAGALSASYTPTTNGNYSVSYMDINACSSDTSLITMVSNIGAGLEEITQTLQIFPNPGTGIFQISTPQFTNTEVLIEVIDIVGKVVYAKSIMADQLILLDLSSESKGMYEVRMRNGNDLSTGKIILQ